MELVGIFRGQDIWLPGNVRGLENAMEWAISMAATAYILPEDLPKEIRPLSDWGDPDSLYDGNLPRFRNRSSRECSAKPAAIGQRPPGASAGIRIRSAVDVPNSAWNESGCCNSKCSSSDGE